jgi:hypothetical protein
MKNELHVSMVKKAGKTMYKVHHVGSNWSHGIKKGEHLTDTELDDFAEMGGKIKHVKEETSLDLHTILGLLEAKRGRPRKSPAPVAKSSDDEEGEEEKDAYKPAGVDTKHIQHEFSRVADLKGMSKEGDHIEFATGKHFVHADTAKKAHGFLMSLKPEQRAQASHMIFSNHKTMKHFEK